MQRRVRDSRPSWRLAVDEPIAGNFYPITAAAALMGPLAGEQGVRGGGGGGGEEGIEEGGGGGEGMEEGGGGGEGMGEGGGRREQEKGAGRGEREVEGAFALTIATDRAQGAASLEDGQLEVMVHRCGPMGGLAAGQVGFEYGVEGRVQGWLEPTRETAGLLNNPTNYPNQTFNRRTTAVDDMRGVGEPLQETMCGSRRGAGSCNRGGASWGDTGVGADGGGGGGDEGDECPGLVARGRFFMAVGPARGAARALRLHQLLLNDPPVVAIARLEGVEEEEAPPSGGSGGGKRAAARVGAAGLLRRLRGRWSGLAGGGAPLPPNVHLVTLMRTDEEEGDGGVIVRLAHMFQVGAGWTSCLVGLFNGPVVLFPSPFNATC
jgi:hypothetical protein